MTVLPGDGPLVKMEVLLREPGSMMNGQALAPDHDSLQWHEVEYIHPADKMLGTECPHLETMCIDCVESWHIDHYFRMTTDTGAVFYSPDYPGEG